jgi:glutamine amidotransferase
VAFYNKVAMKFGEATVPLPQLYKTMIPPANDVNFRSICRNTSSLTVFAHVRMATSEVQQFNSHPFAFGRHVFMHNGSVAGFTSIRRELCCKLSAKAYGNIYGSTDSEHVAALYFTHLGDDWNAERSVDEMKVALERAIADVVELQRKLPDATVPLAASSLNLCTTDGSKLLAFRFRNSDKEEPPSLYYSTKAGVSLNRKYPGHPDYLKWDVPDEDTSGFTGDKMLAPEAYGNHVIVASEPTTKNDDAEWELVPKNNAVLVDFVDGCNNVRIQKIVVPQL